MTLARRDDLLVPLARELRVLYRALRAKIVQGVQRELRVLRLGRKGLLLEATPGLEELDDVQLRLLEENDLGDCEIYGKVVEVSESGVRVRFTAVPPAVTTYFERLLT